MNPEAFVTTVPAGDVQALLFDLDGTLIDSMPHHASAWAEFHRRHRLPFDADSFFLATAGRANSEILAEMLPTHSAADRLLLAKEKESLYREFALISLELIPGFEAVRAAARAHGMKLAICTASTPENMALAFARFGLDAQMDTVVSPADGVRGKPHPDIFLEAAKRLGIAPANCIVFEDAPLGIEAARRAGMRAVALSTSLPAAAFASYDNLLATVADFHAIGISAHHLTVTQKDSHHA